GLMDQMASSVGGFVEIDFKDTKEPVITKLDFDFASCGHSLCIVNTGGSHADLTPEYGAVRTEMEAAASVFGKKVLREVCPEDFYGKVAEVREKAGDRAVLNIEPGLAFGTGTHETTNLCLEVLDRTIKGGERLLDVGTGSGILGIASCILGAKEAEGVDIDPTAVKVAVENAELNGVSDKFTIKVGDLAEQASGKYDIVVANIVANAIMMLSKTVPQFLKEGGLYITSGIIIDRKDEVLACLENLGFKILKVHTKNNWVCIEATI
ncbi:MAG: 50S ribosomal protein L11 methyltransferase, partial [Oscillospiraceae bacterium]|nr:50S ribosomal protein L11 methyltransferase [Oscillospiraceae bacterium]